MYQAHNRPRSIEYHSHDHNHLHAHRLCGHWHLGCAITVLVGAQLVSDGSCMCSTAATCVTSSGTSSSLSYPGGCDSSHALCCSCIWLCWYCASSSATCSISSLKSCKEGNQYACSTKVCKPALSAAVCAQASMSSIHPNGLMHSAVHSVRSDDMYTCFSCFDGRSICFWIKNQTRKSPLVQIL